MRVGGGLQCALGLFELLLAPPPIHPPCSQVSLASSSSVSTRCQGLTHARLLRVRGNRVLVGRQVA